MGSQSAINDLHQGVHRQKPEANSSRLEDRGELLTFLSGPRAYPEPTTQVQHIETHISDVFLTDQYAYKLKKPVRLEFLDFSTLEQRKRACDEEVRLNRRLARDVYLGVIPVARASHGRLRIGGDGVVIDWLVKMRRLPDETSVESLIRGGRLTEEMTERLALDLARLYTASAPAVVAASDYSQAVIRHIAANRDDLLRSICTEDDKKGVVRFHAAQQRWLALFGDLLARRVCDGRIVDGHGDLRPEHIYLAPHLVIIDCLEFSAELRRIDVVDELSFLAMECERLGAPAIGSRILDLYRTESGDDPPAALIDFYKSYRAAVRAKVALLRANQLVGQEAASARSLASEYIRIADRHAAALIPPLLLVVRGPSATGKSTLAAALAQSLALEHCQTDELRRSVFGQTEAGAPTEDRYSPRNRRYIYNILFAAADRLLVDGFSVVMDGTFLSAPLIDDARMLAAHHQAKLLVIECYCPEKVVQDRVNRRFEQDESLSDADYEVHRQQKLVHEPVPEAIATLAVDTTQNVLRQVQLIKERLADLIASN